MKNKVCKDFWFDLICPHYKIIRRDRMSGLGGGVIVGIKSCYKFINRKEFEDESIECVLAEFVFN
jgi:hypothetical protein